MHFKKQFPTWVFLLLTGCINNMVGIRPKAPFASAIPGPLIIAHRGGSLEAPENTLASIKHGVAAGADWQEIDVTLSSDDKVVVIHDDTLERTTNGKGDVERTPIAKLTALLAGQPKWSKEALDRFKGLGIEVPDFGDRFKDEHVPTLQQVLEVPRSRLMIEIKKTTRPARLAERVVAAVQAAHASDRVILGSFEFNIIDAVHQIDPSLPIMGIVDNATALDHWLDLPISVLAVDKPVVPAAMQAAPAGVAVWTWTVYNQEEAETLVAQGAHGIITDAPRKLVAALRDAAVATR